MRKLVVYLAALVLSAQPILCQEITASRPNSLPEMRARFFAGRYEIRNATLTDLIRTAWSVEAKNIIGGPEWMDVNRFDVTTGSRESLKTVLNEQFALVVRNSSRDVPAWTITAGRKPQLQKAEGMEKSGCIVERAVPYSRAAPVRLVCSNVTIRAFATALAGVREASGYIFNYPLLDRTGIEGAWNFSLRWSPRNIYLRSVAAGETISLADAFESQLGLKLVMTKAPTPVLVVEHAVAPRVKDSPDAAPQFEVAVIQPVDPKNQGPDCSSIRVQPGGRVRINMTLKGLIAESYGDISPDRIAGGPKLANSTCWQIEAKAPVPKGGATGWNGPVWNGLDIDSMRKMLGALLVERFKLSAHTENRSIDGYAIISGGSRLRKSDPTDRPGCSEGPAADEKDPRILNPVASRLITCRNLTLAQFAAELNKEAFRSRPLADRSGLAGRYDFTVNFSPPSVFGNVAFPNANATELPSIPDGAISILEALKGQLGLKVEAAKVTAPVLVVESVEEKPTEN